jgi:hypothetical protein
LYLCKCPTVRAAFSDFLQPLSGRTNVLTRSWPVLMRRMYVSIMRARTLALFSRMNRAGQDDGKQGGRERRLRAFRILRESIDLRDTTSYHVPLVSPDQNIQISCTRAEAPSVRPDVGFGRTFQIRRRHQFWALSLLLLPNSRLLPPRFHE